MQVFVGCDHAGLELKLKVMAAFPDLQWQDLGTHSAESIDYPDYADKVCQHVTAQELKNKQNNLVDSLAGESLGLLICGSGQGMAIRANRFPQVRAALCWSTDVVQVARQHNNANVLCLGSRFISAELAVNLLKVFLETKFEGGRHQRRVDKLSNDSHC